MAQKPAEKRWKIMLLIFLLVIPIVGTFWKALIPTKTSGDKKVWASLYTWYGAPGYPAGKWGYPQMDGTPGNWTMTHSNMTNLNNVNVTSNTYFEGKAVGTANALILNKTITKFISSNTRIYFQINISAGNPQAGNISMEILTQNSIYSTVLLNSSFTANQFHVLYRVFPFHFENVSINPLNLTRYEIRIVQRVDTDGMYNISLGGIEISGWKHYNEDYHTVESTEKPGFWYNDPPVYLATAHRVFYNQSAGPWSEIETYGFYNHSQWNEVPLSEAIQYGIYDSLDPVVIRSQLRLMEKAGINVVQIMHPWDLNVVQTILDLAISINSNLTFFLYNSMDIAYIGKFVSQFVENPKYSKYWFRIDGKPVYNYGYTAEPNEIPFATLRQQILELRKSYNLFLFGDGFSSPYLFNEEFLDANLFDGWYYYDTSAFYRHGWGDPAIKNYQADGTLYPMNAWDQLDRVFGQLKVIAESKNKQYCAIIIPGTDNTCVHDFKGHPLYDGRTGTINERAGGLTFNRTWEAAIEANADHACIVSWNELHEGTEIEPTIENGTFYVQSCNYWATRFRGINN